MNETSFSDAEEKDKQGTKISEISLNEISNPVLARLIEEVRNEEIHSINAYNRMHNRHNRSR
jgi:hypothetical protein